MFITMIYYENVSMSNLSKLDVYDSEKVIFYYLVVNKSFLNDSFYFNLITTY